MMQSPETVLRPERRSYPRRALAQFRARHDADLLTLIGLPLLLLVGVLLGLINLLAWIHLVAVVINL